MKKLLVGSGALGIALLMLPVLSAFEAHVINVTAEIENALAADVYSIDFGTVFPQEKLDKQFSIAFSESFVEDGRYDDVEYVLRQKPKCQLNETGQLVVPSLPQFGQVKEDVNGNFICKDEVNYDLMPFLCPYLSKEEITPEPLVEGSENDMKDPALEIPPVPGHAGPLAAFHGPILLASSTFPGGWDLDTTLAYQILGRLAKSEQDSTDTWNIDLKVPCFSENHCAQDWEEFVAANDGDNDADSDEYIQPIGNEHAIFGCDLWLEVTELSIPPNSGTLSVFKVMVNDNGGTATSSDFTVNVSGNSPIPASFPGDSGGTLVVMGAGAYTVTEDGSLAASYDTSVSLDCVGVIAAGENKICVITNDDKPPETGLLVVHKVVVNDNGGNNVASDFQLKIDGGNVVNHATTTVSAGNHTVSETGIGGYQATFSGDCNASGVVNVPVGTTKTCTLTNNDISPRITLRKTVVNDSGGTAGPTNFTMRIDGVVVPHNSTKLVTANAPHTISEDAKAGYSFVSITGSALCPAVLGGTATLNEGQAITCTITNDDN